MPGKKLRWRVASPEGFDAGRPTVARVRPVTRCDHSFWYWYGITADGWYNSLCRGYTFKSAEESKIDAEKIINGGQQSQLFTSKS